MVFYGTRPGNTGSRFMPEDTKYLFLLMLISA
jgi:hypothetical protein